MKGKEVQIVLSVLALVVLGCVFVFYYSKNQVQTTVWINKEGGDGPYKLRTGNREEEERQEKEKLNSYSENNNDIKFKEHPSDHEVIFSKNKGVPQSEKFHKSDRVPEVKY